MKPQLISIVTPSLNSGQFLEQTIQSVLQQTYPNVEYLVRDGGSTDGSLDILRSYEDRIKWISEPDGSVTNAINLGFEGTAGEIFGWLGSDDLYLHETLALVAEVFAGEPEIDIIYGDGQWIDAQGRIIGNYPTRRFDARAFETECFVCQPASFIRRRIVQDSKLLNGRWQSAFDYDLWIRLAKQNAKFRYLPRLLASSRLHSNAKTIGRRDEALEECALVQREHFGKVSFQAAYTFSANRVYGNHPVPGPPVRSIRAYFLSLFMGIRWSPRRPLAYIQEWLSAATLPGFLRWWKDKDHPITPR